MIYGAHAPIFFILTIIIAEVESSANIIVKLSLIKQSKEYCSQHGESLSI